mgnify:CR=1 FL=1
MSEFSDRSTSIVDAVLIDAVNGFGTIFSHVVSTMKDASKNMGIHNRTSQQLHETPDGTLQATMVEDLYIADSNAAHIGLKTMEVIDIVGSEICVASEDGNRLYEAIRAELLKGTPVSISFRNVKNISPIFIYSSIGQLYRGEFSREYLKNKYKIVNISSERRLLIRRTVERVKYFFDNPSQFANEGN